MTKTSFKSGYIAIAGRPNVGKSTLFNALIGERLSIISPKPQTTRTNILGIVTDGDAQMVFLDTPGLLDVRYRLHEFMHKQIRDAIESADILLGIVDATHFDTTCDEEVQKTFKTWQVPKVIALNKSDLVEKEQIETAIQHIRKTLDTPTVLAVSATTGYNLPHLFEALLKALPIGPQFYPEDQLATQPERFFVAEFIREELFLQLHQELPYSVAVAIEEFREDRSKVYIQANILVERTSQKGIVIGSGGRTLKTIGQHARKKIEAFLERPVFLDLHVKVFENWRKKDSALRDLGYGI